MSAVSLPLANSDFDRLGKLLGMLGSEHDGERATAGMMADRFLRDRGTSWNALVDTLRRASHPQTTSWSSPPRSHWSPEPVSPLRNHQRQARECLTWQHLLSDWERGFVSDIAAARSVSCKQADKLAVILAKVRRLRTDERDF